MPARRESYTVVSLRPTGDHAALRRAATALGWRTVACSPWRIAPRDDAEARAALRDALTADAVIVTSPAAARTAAALQALRPRRGQRWYAVGGGTATALRRAGVAQIEIPARADSEGLLALPGLVDAAGRRIGLLTAPGGRDRIAPTLRARGATVLRADVYARAPTTPSAATWTRLRDAPGPWAVPLSSGEALQRLFEIAPAEIVARLREARVVAASARLAQLARELGCEHVRIGEGPRPRQLLAALTTAAHAESPMRDDVGADAEPMRARARRTPQQRATKRR